MKRLNIKMLSVAFAFLAAIASTTLTLTSCKSEKEPKQIFEEQQSGVCMVLNSYYYVIELPNGGTWYCTGIDEDGDLENFTLDEDEVKKEKPFATGTGFFIDDKGTLLTNRHVVNPVVSEDVIKKSATKLLGQIKEFMQAAQMEMSRQFNELEEAKQECYYVDYWGYYQQNHERITEIEAEQRELASQYSDAEETLAKLNSMNSSDIIVTPVSEVGIAYNDTYVTKVGDFLDNNPCVVVKTSDDENCDLALIQLKDKKTPDGKYIFKIKGVDKEDGGLIATIKGWFSSDNNKALDIDDELVMIGYNAGLILGNTKQGIQAQMTTGKVSQKPDGEKILYSIPTLQGSSGSPVVDRKGYVRAVNFAKLRGTEGFNFGIPEEKIRKFIEK